MKERERNQTSVKSSTVCIPYNQRSSLECLLSVAIDKHSVSYTIICCRIKAKLSTVMIEQNAGKANEKERESKCCSRHPSYRLQIFFKAYFSLSYPSCHREYSFFSLLVISLYSKKPRAVLMTLRLNAHTDTHIRIDYHLPCMMLYTGS